MKLLFADLETTGLDPGRNCIIEVAAQLCDPVELGDLRIVDEFHSLVKPDLGAAASADKPAMDMHTSSGLFSRALEHNVGKDGVEKALCAWIEGLGVPKKELYLTGSSVHFDKGFFEAHMPGVMKLMHYRILDVTSVRLALNAAHGKDPMGWTKKKAHTAREDLVETRKELEEYIKNNLG